MEKIKIKKGLFFSKDKVYKSQFHIGLNFCVEKFDNEVYLLLCLGKYDFSFGYRWEERVIEDDWEFK